MKTLEYDAAPSNPVADADGMVRTTSHLRLWGLPACTATAS